MKKVLALMMFAVTAQAQDSESLSIKMELLNEKGNKAIGEVVVMESKYGLVFIPALSGLTPGIHGFHIHEKPSCVSAEKDGKTVLGLGAGGHWDPKEVKQHGLPWQDDAHLGDLPALYVDAEGNASYPVLAPRLQTLDEIKGRALMIHVGGDNHADHPEPLGGGGARMACGVIE